MLRHRFRNSLKKTTWAFVNLLPIVVGILLLNSLAITLFSEELSTALFSDHIALDALVGASIGSIAAGHPLANYLLGGELLTSGVSLVAVTALMVSWVTVGIVKVPAEALMLGTRFAVYRNIICFFNAVAIAVLSVYSLRPIG